MVGAGAVGAGAVDSPVVRPGATVSAVVGAGAAAFAEVGVVTLVGAAALAAAGSVPFGGGVPDSMRSVESSGVPVALSIAPIVSVGSDKGKRFSLTSRRSQAGCSGYDTRSCLWARLSRP